jgi:16S rRNA (cytosine967-C5)-methyltransferase
LTARDVATRVLVRVEKERAFAAAALEAELGRAVQLDARDRGLATELVYGTLRVTPWLDAQLARFAPRGTAKLDPRVRASMTLAAYQLFFMRVPAFAAVNEAVQGVRDARGPRVAAFANAVLRRVSEQAAALRAGGSGGADAERSLLETAVVESTPSWLRDALEQSLGVAGARSFLRCGVEAPAVALRIEHAVEPADAREALRSEWVARLRAAAPDASVEPGLASPLAILVRSAGKPQRLPGWSEGAWSVQEEGSQVAGLSVGARPGETVLDACAGRGNKTALLARAVGPNGAVDACDSSPSKLERLGEELARVGLRARATFAVDWSVGSGDVADQYDAVLVDAPCSGVGTLRRRPEIALRRQAEDLDGLARVQLAIAQRAALHVRPGGRLVYVVCSVLRGECEAVVDALVQSLPEFSLAAAPARLLPHVDGTDGYFIARLDRR